MIRSCIQIGNGKIALVHRNVFPSDIKVIGIVVRDIPRHEEFKKKDPTLKDAQVFSSIQSAVESIGKPFLWDVASDDETHLFFTNEIIKHDPDAKITLAKSFYDLSQMALFEEAIKNTKAKITFIENYQFTPVVDEVQNMMRKHGFSHPLDIYVDFTKNRIKDNEQGRFLHPSLGVFGYEGSHMMTILGRLDIKINQIQSFDDTDMRFPNGKILKHNGNALVKFISKKEDKVLVYTSMTGDIKFSEPLLNFGGDVEYGDERRHRIIVLYDRKSNKKIIGQFEPIPGKERFLGRVLVIENGKITEKEDNIKENTQKIAFEKALTYFNEKNSTPFNHNLIEELNKLAKFYRQT